MEPRLKRPYFLLLLIITLSICCSTENNNSGSSIFKLKDPASTGIQFSNDLPINLDLNIFNYMYYYNGGGTAVGDLNNDGLTDIILSANLAEEKVYLNKGNLVFQDISEYVNIDGGKNSWTNGVAIVDINNDGLLDVYLSQVGNYRNLDSENRLFICTGIDPNGVPSYEEKAAEYGLNFKGFSTQAGFFDYDKDGDLDMYLMNHSLHHNGTFGKREDFINTQDSLSGDRLFRNDGITFTDVTLQAGIHSNVIGYGLGLAFGDVNNDNFPDIYIGNDFHENDYLYINQKDGTFKEDITNQIKHTSRFSMGVDIADINNDGYEDIISLDMLPEDPAILKASEGEDALDIFNFKLTYGYNHQYAKNALQLNQKDNHFKEIASYAGVHATDWSWTPLFFDFDMDGYKDLFISNGIPKRMNDIDYINYISGNDIQYKIQFDQLKREDLGALEKIPEIKLYNKFYQNNQELKFTDLENRISDHDLSYSNSAAYADFDLDGDYDLICNNIDGKAFLYENLSNEKGKRIILKGTKENKFGIGSKITAFYSDRALYFNYTSTRGFQSSMVNEILIPKEGLQQIEVIWPNGEYSLTKEVNSDSIIIDQTNTQNISSNQIKLEQIPTKDLSADYIKGIKHKENPFVEFNREPLIPFSSSGEGPALAVGDLNNDGLEDFYLGSSKRNNPRLFLQQSDGFVEQNLIGLATDSIYEENDAQFADLDGDGDLDLVVAVGGNEYKLTSPYNQPLLYLNKGGQLERKENAFNEITLTASNVTLMDIDNDDDLDLFFGARATPWSYGVVPSSYLLENDGNGNFKNVTSEYFDDNELGFIKDAKFEDINGDNQAELILACEWDGIKIYELKNKKFSYRALTELKGWWNCLSFVDIDGDGDKDLFAGNLGTNSRLKASKEEPVRMYYEDFDDNGTKEQILSYFIKGREIPFSNMMELQKQIPALKKKYLYAKAFSQASLSELLGPEKIRKAKVYTADHLENTLFINDGKGNFDPAPLPKEMQYTSYYDATVKDLNKDGIEDLIPVGNYYYCNVQMGRYDAENGAVLLGNSDLKLEYKNMSNTPLTGQSKKIIPINISDKEAFLCAQNNDQLKLISFD